MSVRGGRVMNLGRLSAVSKINPASWRIQTSENFT